MTITRSQRSGFTLLYAVLVMGVLLSIIFAIYSISYKQVALSGVAKDSQLAFYMADSGAECVKYWDYRGAFATSTPATIICNGTTYPVGGHATTDTCPSGSGTCAISTLTLKYAGVTTNSSHPPEAVINLYKNIDTGESTLLSYGHNTDDKTSNRRLERAIKLVYTPPLSPFCPVNGDVLLLVDVSGSVVDDQGNIAAATKKLIDGLYSSAGSNSKIGLITFGDKPYMQYWEGLQPQANEPSLLYGPGGKGNPTAGSVYNMYYNTNSNTSTNLPGALKLAQYELTGVVATNQSGNIYATTTQTTCADGSSCPNNPNATPPTNGDNRLPDGPLNQPGVFPNIVIIITDGAPHVLVNTNGTYNYTYDAGTAPLLAQVERFSDQLKQNALAYIATIYVNNTRNGDGSINPNGDPSCSTDGTNSFAGCIDFMKRAVVGQPTDTGVATNTLRSINYAYSVDNTGQLDALVQTLTNCNSGS